MHFIDRTIVCNTRAITIHLMMCRQPLMSPLYFRREYDYAASFKVISDALEMVEAGVTDRFVTSYRKKPGSKFASNNRKMTF